MFILSIALGGCLKGPPVEFGISEDTGGHLTYALGAAQALSDRADVDYVEIVTRLIDDSDLGEAYAIPLERLSPKFAIRRLDTGNREYLSKESNAADRPAFTRALASHLARLDRLPDIIHAHFADAAEVAIAMRDRFGIPFVYTAHSLGIDKAGTTGERSPSLARRIAEEDRAVGSADAIIASSRDEAERQLMMYPSACASRIHCVPPGASLGDAVGGVPEEARRLVAPFLRDLGKPIILAIARPVERKNLAGLVAMFGQDHDLRERANLVIVAGLRDSPDNGGAEQQRVIQALLAQMDRHDLYGSLALPKRHTQTDVRALYELTRQTGGVFVNPAISEPYGLTLTEAALHGVPVVATSHGGPRDIVARLQHGMIADPLDPALFTSAIRSLLDDGAEWARASAAGMANARNLDWHGYAHRFVEIVGARTATTIARERPSRLLLCDIDNTLTGCMQGAEHMASFLAKEPSLAFGVATGRSLQEAERLLCEWRQPSPDVLITSVGTEIYWRRGGRLVADNTYSTHIDQAWDPSEIDRRIASLGGVERQPEVEQRRHKRSYFAAEPSAIAAVREAIADMPVRVVHSHGRLLDILPERGGKGAAMIWAARTLEIGLDHVFAAGDSGNDVDMLSACRNGILVANHSSELDHLVGRSTIYLARRPHANGIIEGMQAYAERQAA